MYGYNLKEPKEYISLGFILFFLQIVLYEEVRFTIHWANSFSSFPSKSMSSSSVIVS